LPPAEESNTYRRRPCYLRRLLAAGGEQKAILTAAARAYLRCSLAAGSEQKAILTATACANIQRSLAAAGRRQYLPALPVLIFGVL
jgi:hypothetical protein